MTLVTTASDASLDASTAMYAPQLSGFIAGEDLLLLGPCYIKTSDGKIYKSNATADNEAAEFVGVAAYAAKEGNPCTLYGLGTRFRLAASGLTIGNLLYVGATAGRWDTAATVGDQIGTLQVLSATDVRVIRTAVAGTLDTSEAGAVGTADIADDAVTAAKAPVFVSAEQTGTGSAQNVAHGLAAVPALVLVVPTEHPGTPDTGAFDIAEGTHTSTNVVVTVTANVKFKVLAWA